MPTDEHKLNSLANCSKSELSIARLDIDERSILDDISSRRRLKANAKPSCKIGTYYILDLNVVFVCNPDCTERYILSCTIVLKAQTLHSGPKGITSTRSTECEY